jgi:hypothetical protein
MSDRLLTGMEQEDVLDMASIEAQQMARPLKSWEVDKYRDKALLEAQDTKTRELTLKEVGEWLDEQDGVDYGDEPDEPLRGYVSLDIRKSDIQALKRGEMPEWTK